MVFTVVFCLDFRFAYEFCSVTHALTSLTQRKTEKERGGKRGRQLTLTKLKAQKIFIKL